ncbi:MAG: hypothetical protein KatS3mg027_0675 [Bacteroidia bacterium]|nr:MAG: hypothetical protein KatS3mg027_0675 [Bacteroidia bacterium]
MKLVVLYEELAPYFLVNIEKFADTYQVPVMIICKQVNSVAPFQFQTQSKYLEIIYRENFSVAQLIEKIRLFQPTALMQAGWIYPPYFEITRQLKLSNNILLMDNQWENTIRQRLGSIYFQWKYKSLFHKALVPGSKQKLFARHLGFEEKNIATGFYCCDTHLFEKVYFQRKEKKERHYTFLYTGRYVAEKNIELLWQAFAEICEEYPNQWQLLCAGKGNIKPVQHPQITHLGFIQPKELSNILMRTDVFILPSIFEPWGVVIHEMATAGLPIISSTKVGANEYFVKQGENGYIFKPNNKQELKDYMLKVINMPDDEYFQMCEKSYEYAQKINTDDWIKKIYHLCQI